MHHLEDQKIVTKDIYWIGALDYDIRVFDIVMYTEYGTTYNSYLVKGSQKNAVFETVKSKFFDDYLKRLKEVIDPTKLDYIIVNHTEPDHAGSISHLIDINPNITIVGSSVAIKYLQDLINKPFKSLSVKDNDTLDLGDKTIKFIMTPFLHWPDTMYSYIEESKTLITCDSFGCHYCDDKVFNDLIEGDFYDAYKYYFDVIMGPFKPFVLKALNKISNLEINNICPGHGPVLRTDLEKYIKYYKQWATVTPSKESYIVIPYVSAYGFTKELAYEIEKGIQSTNKYEVYLYDLVEFSKDKVLDKISSAKGVLFGSPTLINDALPPIWEILISLNPTIHKGLYSGAFGSYGWSGEAVPNIMARLKQLNFKTPLDGLRIKLKPSDDELKQAYDFGKNFANCIN